MVVYCGLANAYPQILWYTGIVEPANLVKTWHKYHQAIMLFVRVSEMVYRIWAITLPMLMLTLVTISAEAVPVSTTWLLIQVEELVR